MKKKQFKDVELNMSDLFKEVEVKESTMIPFWNPPVGTSNIIFVEVPKEAKTVEIPKGSGKKQERLFFTIIDGNGRLGTWTMRYLKKVTTASLLGQITQLMKDEKIKRGTMLEVTRIGSGQASRYSVKFVKMADEKKLAEKVAELEKIQKEAPQKTDIKKLF